MSRSSVDPANTKPMIVEAQYLKVGDLISFGQKIAVAPSRGIKTPSGKVDLVVTNKNGIRIPKTWNAKTQIAIRRVVSIPESTFNVCNICGGKIEKDDYCHAETIGDCKTGKAFDTNGQSRFVTLQHHLQCNNPLAKTLW